MLIFSRCPGQTFIIGDKEITITILDIQGYQVQLGIDAPREIPVHRREVYERIQAKKNARKEETLCQE